MTYAELHDIDSLAQFPAWDSAAGWLEDAINSGCVDEVEDFIRDSWGDEELHGSPSDTYINDMLWHDEEVHAIIEKAKAEAEEDDEEP